MSLTAWSNKPRVGVARSIQWLCYGFTTRISKFDSRHRYDLLFSKASKTGSVAYPAFYVMEPRCSLPEAKAVGMWSCPFSSIQGQGYSKCSNTITPLWIFSTQWLNKRRKSCFIYNSTGATLKVTRFSKSSLLFFIAMHVQFCDCYVCSVLCIVGTVCV
jgi:hypothetical protein